MSADKKINDCGCASCSSEQSKSQKGDLTSLPEAVKMVLCEECGNKRCPHAFNHDFNCSGSNDLGQLVWNVEKASFVEAIEG